MNEYFHDERFAYKKPNLDGNWRERYGDNIYTLIDGHWRQSRNRYHLGNYFLHKDTRYPYVFVGKNFWYYGKKAIEVPEPFKALIPDRQGVRTNHQEHLVKTFIEWIQSMPTKGLIANPTNNLDFNGCSRSKTTQTQIERSC